MRNVQNTRRRKTTWPAPRASSQAWRASGERGMWGLLGPAPTVPATSRSKEILKENERLKREVAELKRKVGGSSGGSGGSAGGGAGGGGLGRCGSPSHGASQPSDEPLVIVVGDILQVDGLESRPDLNGREARVVSHDPLKDVWHVLIDGETKKSALRAENLRPSRSRAAAFLSTWLAKFVSVGTRRSRASSLPPVWKPTTGLGGPDQT